LKIALEEKDVKRIYALIAEYDEFLEKNPHFSVPGMIISENRGSERGINFTSSSYTATLRHSDFKREMYISKRLHDAELEAKSTTVRYSMDEVLSEMRAIAEGRDNV